MSRFTALSEADDQIWAAVAPPEAVTFNQADLRTLHNITSAPGSEGDGSVPVSTIQERWAIGNDDRVLWTNREYPYSAMGKVTRPGSWCSASLIGPRIVATARHCYESGVPYRFNPAYDNGETLPGANAIYVLIPSGMPDEGPCNEKEDWVLFVLDANLGDQLGYLGAKTYDAESQAGRAIFFNYGYPQDKNGGNRPYRMQGISVTRKKPRCDAFGPLDTDVDASPGNSGGPLWALEDGSRYQYGVTSNAWLLNDQLLYTSFAAGQNWVAAIIQARQDYP
ncbi:trypsin-like cysteine/serine peptidase domain-containing protein [Apiospora aurea]|uniref:Trypsin-like cysteine/serine peptidase domain-containing protein n=1 Tax=Apiospora aurea TaxID=335848 RepID=A0ABR1QAP6_9PEZI